MGTTVLIVDDHPCFRASARKLLESEGFEVVGEAGDGDSAVAQSAALRPDLILLDVQLPDIDGFAVAARVTGSKDAPAVILCSSREASDFGPLVATSGARGFVAKGELCGATLRALLEPSSPAET
ncbi:MAG: response regulator [Solirubrobacteraceae bacterium]